MWHRAEKSYFDPDEFRIDAQNFIQNLRTVEYLAYKIIKEKAPGLEQWYRDWRKRSKNEPLMSWFVGTRTRIVHAEDMERKSFVRAEVIASYLNELPRQDVEAHLFDDPLALLRSLPRELLEKQVFKHGALRIERRWVANDFPDMELLDAFALAYGRFNAFLHDLHIQMNLTVDQLELGGRSACMIGHEERRSTVLSLATGEQLQLASKPVEIDLAESAERYGMPVPLPEIISVDELAHRTFEWARDVFLKDGYHSSILFLLRGCEVVEHHLIEAEDRQQKYLLARHFAHEAVRQSADGVMMICEMWTAEKTADPYQYASDIEDRGEELALLLATKSGQVLHLSATLERDGEEVRLGETTREDGFPMMFAPFYEAWGVRPTDAIKEWAARRKSALL